MPNSLKISVIGKNNQAARHIALLKNRSDVELSAVYYPREAKEPGLPLTHDFGDVLASDAVIVASPTPTHYEYLELLEGFKGYVLIEKPAVSTLGEGENLKAWSRGRKARTRINFNFMYSDIVSLLKKISLDKRLGRLIAFDIHTSQGLAFTEKYKNSWRSQAKSTLGVIETVGVHFVHLVTSIFGRIDKSEADLMSAADGGGPPDTSILRLTMASGLRATLRHSYGAPFYNRFFLLGTNGYWEYDGSKARLFSPRESFDTSGRFATPALVHEEDCDYAANWRDSLARALDDFLRSARSGDQFESHAFDIAVDAMKPILEAALTRYSTKKLSR